MATKRDKPAKSRKRGCTCCLLLAVVCLGGGAGLLTAGVFAARWSYYDLYAFSSGAMEPAFESGEWVLIDGDAYGLRVPFTDNYPDSQLLPDRGDLIAFTLPPSDRTYVRRVVGLPGDSLTVRDGILRLDGDAIEITSGDTTSGMLYPTTYEISLEGGHGVDQDFITVSPGRFFALSDDRSNTHDSRTWGELRLHSIRGEVVARIRDTDGTWYYEPL
jgi:signal peptidase I